ncbi:MAG: hydrolase [Kiritimatiellia bacterium]|nr:hydrolase [Kiritimatiellia bacterium]
MFTRNNTILLVIDIQERLLPQIQAASLLAKNALILIESCKILNVPVLVTEQYPEGIGPTIATLYPALDNCPKIAKKTFSCCREPSFMKALMATGRKQVIITGTETHVCVFQTAAELIQNGYAVQVAADAVGSRTTLNKEIGLDRMRARGVEITSVESAVFELLGTSDCAEFKQILRLVK